MREISPGIHPPGFDHTRWPLAGQLERYPVSWNQALIFPEIIIVALRYYPCKVLD